MKLLVTVDCDFAGYDPLYAHRCTLDEPAFFVQVQQALALVREETGTSPLTFIHTSPFVRREHDNLCYTDGRWRELWQAHVAGGGSVGLHPHEEEPDGSAYYYYYPDHMRKVLANAQAHLRAMGLPTRDVRCGYCAGSERLFPVLAKLGLTRLHDNMGGDFPEAYAFWGGAPLQPYAPSVDNRRARGDAPLHIIPIAFAPGTPYTGWRALSPEALTPGELRELWRLLPADGGPATLLIHAYAARRQAGRIRRALRFLARHGAQWLRHPDELNGGT